MNEQTLETLKQLEIKKAPEKQSLEAANQSYTKDQLAHFIERHELSIAKSWKKAEIVEALTEWMNESQTELLQSDSDLLSFYNKSIVDSEKAIDIYDINSDNDLDRILLLIEHGLAFNIDGQLWTTEETPDIVKKQGDSKETPASSEDSNSLSKSDEEKPSQKNKSNVSGQTLTSFKSEEDRIAHKKQQRLDYLKTQAKKKKRKKRK